MLKNLSKIEGSNELTKSNQKSILGGITEYTSDCSPWSDGAACLTGFAHCPTGFCAGGVCSPSTGG